VRKDIPSVSFDTPIPEVYQYLLSQDMPVVVLDRGSVKGLITRRNIVELLASRVPAGESGAVS
jgi:predicted transcriptional regulator